MTANHRPLEEGDIELIDRVRATPCLYNTKDPNFRLMYKKDQEWQSIADSLAMSHWEARKRWTVLRDRYARELKQLMLHPDSTEYGKNDFFLRMDFIRNFVKKREVKRKRGISPGTEIKDEKLRIRKLYKEKCDKLRPMKLYKVKCETNGFGSDGNEVSQSEKSYTMDDSQYMSNGKYSYDEELSQEHIQRAEYGEDGGSVDQQTTDQGYNDYVDVTYETVEEDQEALTQDGSENYMLTSPVNSSSKDIEIKPESSGMVNAFSISSVEDDKMPSLPQQQQMPVITNVCTEAASSSVPVDTEEYFSKTIGSYLRHLSPRYKIKAKVEMMQIIEKYIDLEESNS